MGRNNSGVWKTIHSLCNHDKFSEDRLYERAKLLLSTYRNLCWQTTVDTEDTISDLCVCASTDVDGALIYLETFAPEKERDVFEDRIGSLFNRRWMMDIVENAMVKTKDFPDYGEMYFEIISKCYLTKWKYTDNEMLEILNLERSRFYDRKKEAVMIFGISLWGTAIPQYRKNLSGESSYIPA